MTVLIAPEAADPASTFVDADGNIDYAAALKAGRRLRSTEAHGALALLGSAPGATLSAVTQRATSLVHALSLMLRTSRRPTLSGVQRRA